MSRTESASSVANTSTALYRIEKAVRQKVESQLLKLNDATEYARAKDVTFNTLLDGYMAEELPSRASTQGSYTSIFKRRLPLPLLRWEQITRHE